MADSADLIRATVLVVDDDAYIRESLSDILRSAGYEPVEAVDGRVALQVLEEQAVDLVLLDLEMPRVNGMDVLRRSAVSHPQVPIIIVSGKGTIKTAVEATKLGADDFLEKPVEPERALLTIKNVLEKSILRRQRDRMLSEAREQYSMVGSSERMQGVYRLIDKAARVDSKVLIVGETGSGKELIARAIHLNSSRRANPFVAVNCAAIPEELIESELFGHEKGSFTGARDRRRGKFELASSGTLFLDEVADMSLMTQAKVLRAIEDGYFMRVGGESRMRSDFRLIAATNKDLEERVEDGSFRHDLYYRMNVISIRVPPLKDRWRDIPDLVDHFLHEFCDSHRMPPKTLAPGALVLLCDHDWPGNVRELKNVVERLVVLSDHEVITLEDVEYALERVALMSREAEARESTLREAREKFEATYIRRVLDQHDWQIQEVADVLGIARSHLWRKMKQFGLEQGVA